MKAKRDVKRLTKVLGHKNELRVVRDDAARALGMIGDTYAVEPLIVVLRDNYNYWVEIRIAAAEGLGKIGGARAAEALIAALRDSDAKIRAAAIGALGQVGDARAVEQFIAALKDNDARVRVAAAESLGRVGDARAVDALLSAPSALGPEDLKAVVNALVTVGAPAIEPLVGTLKGSYTGRRWNAVEALGRLGWQPSEDESGAAYWICKRRWDRCVRIGALAIEPLIDALRPFSWHEEAASALGQIGAPAVMPLITALGECDAGTTREEAVIDALAKVGAPAVAPLVRVLGDGDPQMRLRAANALKKLGWVPSRDLIGAEYCVLVKNWDKCIEMGDLAIGPLSDALTDRSEYVRESAAKALKELGWTPGLDQVGAAYWAAIRNWDKCVEMGSLAVEPLIRRIDSDGPNFDCVSAVKALGKIEDPRAVGPLIGKLSNSNSGIRKAAAECLVHLYQSGVLGADHMQQILAQRGRITEPYRHFGHAGFGDDSDSDTWAAGIGVAFPI